jgi:hypothetical protein
MGEAKRRYEATDACETTMTRRFACECACQTYPGNQGVCATFQEGSNGRCVYCDHERGCQVELEEATARRIEMKVEANIPVSVPEWNLYVRWKKTCATLIH